jgi:hypothetical protein
MSGNRLFADLASDLVDHCHLPGNTAVAARRRKARTVATENSRKGTGQTFVETAFMADKRSEKRLEGDRTFVKATVFP